MLPQENISFAGSVQAADQIHRCTLTRTAGADQRHEIALIDAQRDAVDGGNFSAFQAVNFVHVVEFDERGHSRDKIVKTLYKTF